MLETKIKSTVRSDWASSWLWAADEDLELGLPGGSFSMTHPGVLEENPARIGSTLYSISILIFLQGEGGDSDVSG